MDPEKVKFWEKHHKNVFATGKPETMEFLYKSPQGKEYYFVTIQPTEKSCNLI